MTARAFMTRWPIAVAVVLACGGVPLAATARSLGCPAPQAVHGPGVLKETPVQIAELGSLLASGDRVNRAPVVVADLRKRYPGVSNAEIANYLITAYCPVVAKLDGLSMAEQRARMEQFAHQARVAVYGK